MAIQRHLRQHRKSRRISTRDILVELSLQVPVALLGDALRARLIRQVYEAWKAEGQLRLGAEIEGDV
jgi:hypothetical protein